MYIYLYVYIYIYIYNIRCYNIYTYIYIYNYGVSEKHQGRPAVNAILLSVAAVHWAAPTRA